MNTKFLLVLFLCCLFFFGCGGNRAVSGVSLTAEASSEIIEDEPDWWSNPEEKKGFMIGKGEGVSRDKRGARKKAINAIINDFRIKSRAIAEGRSEDFFKEVGSGASTTVYNEFKDTQIAIWNGATEAWVEFKSTTVVEKSVDENGRPYNIFRHYLVGGLDEAAADRKLLETIKREKELLTAMEGTKAYKKLQDDLERYKGKL
tara:strand:+ start:49 stop:657 length:609 start_codon:yes stop_codon:yes gene_type:complete